MKENVNCVVGAPLSSYVVAHDIRRNTLFTIYNRVETNIELRNKTRTLKKSYKISYIKKKPLVLDNHLLIIGTVT